jgi:hypothetical protein
MADEESEILRIAKSFIGRRPANGREQALPDGGAAMADDYCFEFIDESGAVLERIYRAYRDDLDALDYACRRAVDHLIEIRQGSRRVARVKPGEAPTLPMDSRSG